MKKIFIFKIMYITMAFFILLSALIVTWGLSYSNYYVNEVGKSVNKGNFEILLKNNDYYYKDPIYKFSDNDFTLNVFKVSVLVKNDEGKIEQTLAYSFYLTNINTDNIRINNNNNDVDNSKIVVTCNQESVEVPINSIGYSKLDLLDFNLMTDKIKNSCNENIDKLEIFDANGIKYHTINNLPNILFDNDFYNNGIKGSSSFNTLLNFFPFQVVITMIIVVIVYIFILILLWNFVKYTINRRKKI